MNCLRSERHSISVVAIHDLHVQVVSVLLQHIGELLVVAEEDTRHGVPLHIILLELGKGGLAGDADGGGSVIDLIINGG